MCSSGYVLPDLCTNVPSHSCSILVKLFLRFCKEVYIGDFGVCLSDCLTSTSEAFKADYTWRSSKKDWALWPWVRHLVPWKPNWPVKPSKKEQIQSCLPGSKELPLTELMLTGWYEMCLYWFQRESCYEEAFPKNQGWLVRNHFVLNNSEADAKVN